MADYERINFNIKSEILQIVDGYCSSGYGRSALLNYLVAESLKDGAMAKRTLDDLVSKRREK